MTMQPARNPEGYLENWKEWTRSTALQIATAEHLVLTDAHWEVLLLVRSFYETFQTSPPNRVLVKHIKSTLGADKDSIYLHQLFPGTALQISKLAGIPKPKKCL